MCSEKFLNRAYAVAFVLFLISAYFLFFSFLSNIYIKAVFVFIGAMSFALIFTDFLYTMLRGAISNKALPPAEKKETTHHQIAKIYIIILGEGDKNPEERREMIEEEIKLGNFSLEDIGSSQGDLDRMINDCHITRAQNHLRKLRRMPRGGENPFIFPLIVDELIKSIACVHIPLNKLGTNEEEVAYFIKRANQIKSHNR